MPLPVRTYSSILARVKTAVVVNSRQPLRPCGQTGWVQATAEAVRWVSLNNMKLLSSVGMQTWELATAVGVLNKVPLCVLLPATSKESAVDFSNTLAQDFSLDSNLVEILSVIVPEIRLNKITAMQSRDQALLSMADIILPVSVSPLGNMKRLIEKAIANGKKVNRDFQIEYNSKTEPLSYLIDSKEVNPEIESFSDSYLIHWTRAGNSVWPGERLIDYYRDVISSSEYPRSVLATLTRIVQSGTILATNKNMPSGIATVSFSALPPGEAISLMRWRQRHAQMSFEPYGIGISREVAKMHGVKEVRYTEKRQESNRDIWLTQSRGKITDWSNEKEYRHLGDVNLNQFAHNELLLFCKTESEAESLAQTTGYATVSMTREKTVKANVDKPRTT